MDKTAQHLKADGEKTNPLLLEQGMPRALMCVNRTLDYGALKYEAHSWRRVPDAISRYDAAARRHRQLRDSGEMFDEESGLYHIAHEIVCNLMLLELELTGKKNVEWWSFNPPPTKHKGNNNV